MTYKVNYVSTSQTSKVADGQGQLLMMCRSGMDGEGLQVPLAGWVAHAQYMVIALGLRDMHSLGLPLFGMVLAQRTNQTAISFLCLCPLSAMAYKIPQTRTSKSFPSLGYSSHSQKALTPP